jgi:CRP-like cAMP-binding protein
MPSRRRLKNEAMEAASKGNWKVAAGLYGKLELMEDEGLWPLKQGECLRKLGDNAAAVQALSRAMESYARKDLLLKAIAVCKVILEIDPKHTRAQQKLATLHTARMGDAQPTSDVHPVPETDPAVGAPADPPLTDSEAPIPVDLVTTAWSPAVRAGPRTRPPRAASGIGPALSGTETPSGHLARLAPLNPESAPPLVQTLSLATLVPGAHPVEQSAHRESCFATEIPINADDFTPSPSRVTQVLPAPQAVARVVLPKTPFLSALSEDQLRTVIDRVQLIALETDEVLFSAGDAGDVLYVVASGEIAVLAPQEVARLHEGEFFGEIALLTNQARTTTTRATTPSQVLALGRTLVHDLVAESPELLKILLRFLRDRLVAILADTSPMLASFPDGERRALASKFHFLEVARHSQMVNQGEDACGLFILLAGEAIVIKDGKEVAHLRSGAIFGEVSVVPRGPASATVITLEKSFVLCLHRSELGVILMTHPQVLAYLTSLADNPTGLSLDTGGGARP